MNKLITFAALTSTLLVSALAHAATTTELKVTGVIRPAACTPSFTGGGTVDFGVIPPNTLSDTAATPLAGKHIPFTITCDASTKVAIRALDNRKTSIAPGVAAVLPTTPGDNLAFGLGTVAGKKVGAYIIRISTTALLADGAAPSILSDNTSNAGVWANSGSTVSYFANDGSLRKSFAPLGTTAPGSYKSVSGNLYIHPVIDKKANLDLTGDVPLDGSATIEVQYL
ncbi:DUF1120 domain-containing protein [Herbaspirillum rhizosphaerae]|uniref:DUF1120 domain-containing protein n=1 Tax=Herbaspirillum rhizosphaerae TaxID=346179 RepID=UPI00067CBAC3|nr:DUF1120 domain-containing protein [Herbaspirillum rhizosphaerae]